MRRSKSIWTINRLITLAGLVLATGCGGEAAPENSEEKEAAAFGVSLPGCRSDSDCNQAAGAFCYQKQYVETGDLILKDLSQCLLRTGTENTPCNTQGQPLLHRGGRLLLPAAGGHRALYPAHPGTRGELQSQRRLRSRARVP